MPRSLLALSLLLLAPLAARALPTRAPASAQTAAERLAVGERYLAAYARLDLEALAPFWSERSSWCDPTTLEIGGDPRPVLGRDAIAASLRAATAGTEGLRIDYDERFASGEHVLALGTLRYVLPAATLGPGAVDARIACRVVSVLRVEGDTVLEHVDYSDFRRWRATVDAARAGRR